MFLWLLRESRDEEALAVYPEESPDPGYGFILCVDALRPARDDKGEESAALHGKRPCKRRFRPGGAVRPADCPASHHESAHREKGDAAIICSPGHGLSNGQSLRPPPHLARFSRATLPFQS
jgi:hypothetical protein